MINISDLQRYISNLAEVLIANWEITIWLSLNCMFWGGLTSHAVVSVKTRKRKAKRFLRKKIFDRIENANLNNAEIKTLSKLQNFVRFKKSYQSVNVLSRTGFNLVSKSYLNKLNKWHRKTKVFKIQTIISAIRIKLKLVSENINSVVTSTVDFKPGSLLSISPNSHEVTLDNNTNYIARIETSTSVGMQLSFVSHDIDGSKIFSESDSICFSVPLTTGIYIIHSSIISVKDNYILVAHREQIKRIQRRKWIRAPIVTDAWVILNNGHGEACRCSTVDLSGGGATIKLIESSDRVSDIIWFRRIRESKVSLRINYNYDGLNPIVLTIPSIPKRFSGFPGSKEGCLIHVEFKSISNKIRDQLLSWVYNMK